MAVPLMYLHNAAPTLEPPSDESHRVADKRAKTAIGMSKPEAERLKVLKEKEGLTSSSTGERVRVQRPKKKGGPNPLSCMKKKVKPGAEVPRKVMKVKAGQVEKKRKRVKIPKHVKEVLKKEIKTIN